MEKFIELIRDMHDECFDRVLRTIADKKIPVAVFSVADLEKSFDMAKKATINVTHFITLPGVESDEPINFKIISIDEAINQNLHFEYIFTLNTFDARVAAKNFPASKVLCPENENTTEIYDVFMSNLPALKNFYDTLIDEAQNFSRLLARQSL